MSKTDPPETYDQYFWRIIATAYPNTPLNELHEDYDEMYKPVWQADEQEKAEYRKLLERETREHEQKVERLKIEIERQKERIRREEKQKREREEREEKRKKEQEEERERRDPTPNFEPFPPSIPYEIRSRHVYVPGGTQRGKSTQLHSIIFEDIMQGNGVAVLDPKRDLLRLIVHSLPETRVVDGETRRIIDDIVYLDLKTPIPLNFLDRDPEESERVVNDLIYIVTKGDDTLKAAEPLLEKIIRTFLLVPDTTITDIYRFLKPTERRKAILSQLESIDAEFAEMWTPFPKDGVATLERRMSPFYFNPGLKAIFDARTPPLNITDILDNKKILLVDLSPPQDKNASLYGSLIIAQIMSAINRRARMPKYRRIPFFLHVDEFELCQTASFAGLLSVAGGLGLRLTLGNQYLGQVLDANLAAILGNNPSYIFFQLSEKDASQFRAVVDPYRSERLAQLEPHHACFKVGSNPPVFAKTKRLHVMTDVGEEEAESMLENLREHTIARYRADSSAQSSQKRTGDSPPSNTSENSHNEGNGADYDNIAAEVQEKKDRS